MGGKVKVGDKIMRLNEHEYLYNGKFEYCEVVKIFEPKEEKKVSKPKITVCGINEEEVKHFPKGAIFSEYAVDELTEKDRKRLLYFYGRKAEKSTMYNKWLKKEKKVKVMSQKKFRKLDYLSVKVVKVEKKKDKYFAKGKVQGRMVGLFKKDGEICSETIKIPKGTWFNGENLDEIKFPAYCSWKAEDKIVYGEINTNYNEHKQELEYELSDITKQVDGDTMGSKYSVQYSGFSLKKLFENRDIHILKAKIVLFEESKL